MLYPDPYRYVIAGNPDPQVRYLQVYRSPVRYRSGRYPKVNLQVPSRNKWRIIQKIPPRIT